MFWVFFDVGHCDCSYKNPTERCSWHAAECGRYRGVIFITFAVTFQSFTALSSNYPHRSSFGDLASPKVTLEEKAGKTGTDVKTNIIFYVS